MPAHDGVGRHDGRHTVQQAAPELLAFCSESPALVVVQPELPTLQLLFEDPVLLDEVIDRALRHAPHPAR